MFTFENGKTKQVHPRAFAGDKAQSVTEAKRLANEWGTTCYVYCNGEFAGNVYPDPRESERDSELQLTE